jgi:hypothetical protein
LCTLFDQLTEHKETAYHAGQCYGTHSSNSINTLQEVLDEQMISQGLWPGHSPDLNPYDLYLWDTLQDGMCPFTTRTKENVWQEISSTASLCVYKHDFHDVRPVQKQSSALQGSTLN